MQRFYLLNCYIDSGGSEYFTVTEVILAAFCIDCIVLMGLTVRVMSNKLTSK